MREGIEWQAEHAEKGGAPGTGRFIRATLKLLDGDTATGRSMANWQELAVKDAMLLRIAGAGRMVGGLAVGCQEIFHRGDHLVRRLPRNEMPAIGHLNDG